MKVKWAVIIILFSVFLVGCNEVEVVSKPPDAEETLRLDSNSDIFQWEGSIYKTNIQWVDELTLSEKEKIGEIEFTASKPEDFINGAANRLPIGAEIYSTKERGDVLIVKYDNVIKYYLVLAEG